MDEENTSSQTVEKILRFLCLISVLAWVSINWIISKFCKERFDSNTNTFEGGFTLPGSSFLIEEGPFNSSCEYSNYREEVSYIWGYNTELLLLNILFFSLFVYFRFLKSKNGFLAMFLLPFTSFSVLFATNSRMQRNCWSTFDWNTQSFPGGNNINSGSNIEYEGIFDYRCSYDATTNSIDFYANNEWLLLMSIFLLVITCLICNAIYFGNKSMGEVYRQPNYSSHGNGNLHAFGHSHSGHQMKRYRCMRPGCGYEEHGNFVGLKKCLRCGSSMNHR